MSNRTITEEFVAQVAEELRDRYKLDGDDIRALGAGLAQTTSGANGDTKRFALGFVERHQATFDRLAE